MRFASNNMANSTADQNLESSTIMVAQHLINKSKLIKQCAVFFLEGKTPT